MFTLKSGKPKHEHEMELDSNGDGTTTSTSKGSSHDHEVKNWKVLESDGHTHDVSEDTKMSNKGETVHVHEEQEGYKEPELIEEKSSKSYGEKLEEKLKGIKVTVDVKVSDK